MSRHYFFSNHNCQASAINFFGITQGEQSYIGNDCYAPFIPYNAISQYGQYGKLGNEFDVNRLPKTHIKDILAGRYRKETFNFSLGEVIPISSVLASVQQNVCALSRGIGMPIGTGILISPHLLITARHVIEEVPLQQIRIRQGFQLVEGGMHYGSCMPIQGVVEEDSQLDYAIVLLQKPLPFQPTPLCMNRNYLGASMLIHHPWGGPKQVSIHATHESDYYQFDYSSFHDSQKGSSGGVYINADAQVFALHLLNDGTTTARLMCDIWSQSQHLKMLYTDKGFYKTKRNQYHLFVSGPVFYSIRLHSSNYSKNYLDELEGVRKPNGFEQSAPLPIVEGVKFKRHHIVPHGDMEFLWVMGQEYAPLGECLKSVAFSKLDEINGIAWAPWNIFIGPAKRSDDEMKGDVREEVRPAGFPELLWNNLQTLYLEIQAAWQERYRISQSREFRQFRVREIGRFDHLDSRGSTRDGNINQMNFTGVRSFRNPQYSGYGKCLMAVLKRMKQIRQVVPNSMFVSPHPYNPKEWLWLHGKFKVQNVEPSQTSPFRF